MTRCRESGRQGIAKQRERPPPAHSLLLLAAACLATPLKHAFLPWSKAASSCLRKISSACSSTFIAYSAPALRSSRELSSQLKDSLDSVAPVYLLKCKSVCFHVHVCQTIWIARCDAARRCRAWQRFAEQLRNGQVRALLLFDLGWEHPAFLQLLPGFQFLFIDRFRKTGAREKGRVFNGPPLHDPITE